MRTALALRGSIGRCSEASEPAAVEDKRLNAGVDPQSLKMQQHYRVIASFDRFVKSSIQGAALRWERRPLRPLRPAIQCLESGRRPWLRACDQSLRLAASVMIGCAVDDRRHPGLSDARLCFGFYTDRGRRLDRLLRRGETGRGRRLFEIHPAEQLRSDGTSAKGFLAGPLALQTALDISDYGGWRNYMAHLNLHPRPPV